MAKMFGGSSNSLFAGKHHSGNIKSGSSYIGKRRKAPVKVKTDFWGRPKGGGKSGPKSIAGKGLSAKKKSWWW